MIGQNIRKLRTEKQMTQKALAAQLFVTAQAVSRWENGEVEPSLSTVTEIARIFQVSTDEILGIAAEPQSRQAEAEPEPEPEPTVRTEYIYKEAPPVLGVCETCNKPIYSAQELIREDGHIICKSCRDKREESKLRYLQQTGIRHRKQSLVWGTIAAAAMLITGLIYSAEESQWALIGGAVTASLMVFTLLSCLLLRNNFIGSMIATVFSWGFVKCPGLIVELDLEGIIWFLTVKLLFWVLGFLLACVMGALAIALGGVLSLFVYPFALRKNIAHPEIMND